MAIGELPDGKRPTVQEYKNRVAVWVETGDSDPGDPATGLVMSAEAAIDTALRMLATAGPLQGNAHIVLPVRSVELLEAVEVNEDMAARLVLDCDGAPLALDISAMNLATLAAEFTAASRKIG